VKLTVAQFRAVKRVRFIEQHRDDEWCDEHDDHAPSMIPDMEDAVRAGLLVRGTINGCYRTTGKGRAALATYKKDDK
jgi:hypothetical protein